MADTTDSSASFSFTYTGTGLEIISRSNENGAMVNTKVFYEGNMVFNKTTDILVGNEEFGIDISKGQIQGLENKRYSVSITALKSIVALNYGKYCYLDAIRVYK